MAMEKTKNIWDKISLNPENQNQNVLKILKEQAELLANKTKGVLYAEVNPIDVSEEKTFEPGIFYNFYIYAPYLGNIRVLFFTVLENREKMRLIDRINNNANVKDAESIDDLIQKIEDIISGKEAAEILSNLYASSMVGIGTK
jgi:hypothetical protein